MSAPLHTPTTTLSIVLHPSGARLLVVDVAGNPHPFVVATLSDWQAGDVQRLTNSIITEVILTHNNQVKQTEEKPNVVKFAPKQMVVKTAVKVNNNPEED